MPVPSPLRPYDSWAVRSAGAARFRTEGRTFGRLLAVQRGSMKDTRRNLIAAGSIMMIAGWSMVMLMIVGVFRTTYPLSITAFVVFTIGFAMGGLRSEERRVGKEGRAALSRTDSV